MPKKGYIPTPAHRLAQARAHLNQRHTRVAKQKIAVALLGHSVTPATREKMRATMLANYIMYKRYVRHAKLKHPKLVVSPRKKHTHCEVCFKAI